MTAKSAEEVANAVLYEGYMLYPYRASSVKNRVRWNFGVVYPRDYSEANGRIDPWSTQTECLLIGNADTRISAKVRFLQAIDRTIAVPAAPLSVLPEDPQKYFRAVPELRIGEQLFQTWQEATERNVSILPVSLRELTDSSLGQVFEFPATKDYEELRETSSQIAGLITRSQEEVSGVVEVSASCVREGIYKVTLRVTNDKPIADAANCGRESALRHALLSAHSILRVEQGEFISLLDPSDDVREFASSCNNFGTWPVLAGENGQKDTMLSSPIILYDYPQIAPESAGDLFDGTEIDEILALRILTLTEDEKREMREGDARAKQILERTEALPPEEFAKLHGALRGLRPVSEDRS